MVKSPRLLAVCTATRCTSIAVIEDGRVFGEMVMRSPRTHTDLLLPNVRQLLAGLELDIPDFDAFVAVVGPGAFTGLRVGVATVKGLATAADRPTIAISSLLTLAAQFPASHFPICALLDARKSEIYVGRYCQQLDEPVSSHPERVMTPEQLLDEIDEETLFVGDGATVYRPLIEARLGRRAHFAPVSLAEPRAALAAALADREFRAERTIPSGQLTPVYIRRSEAEIMWEKSARTSLQ